MGSTKNALITYKALDGATMDEDLAGPPTNITFMDNISVHIKFTGTPAGEFFIQGSNIASTHYNGTMVPADDEWVSIPFVDETGAPVSLDPAGADGMFLCNAQGLAFSFLRVIYVFDSSTGTANAWVTGKSI